MGTFSDYFLAFQANFRENDKNENEKIQSFGQLER